MDRFGKRADRLGIGERCLRATDAWEQMAARVERTGRMRAETEAKKAAALVPAQ